MCEKKQIPATVSNAVFMDACCKLVLVSIQDKVKPVYFGGLDQIKCLCGGFFVVYAAEASEVVRNNLEFEDFLPVIIASRLTETLVLSRHQADIGLPRSVCMRGMPPVMHISSATHLLLRLTWQRRDAQGRVATHVDGVQYPTSRGQVWTDSLIASMYIRPLVLR